MNGLGFVAVVAAFGVLTASRASADSTTNMVTPNAMPSGVAVLDQRATDSADLFFDLCVGNYVPSASKGDANADRFEISKLNPDLSAKLSKGPIKSVRAKASNAMMLISYEPQGLCMVRLSRADEASVATAFEASVVNLAVKLQTSAEPEPVRTRDLDGMKVTYRAWRIVVGQGKAILLAITTSPEYKGYVSQHMMTVSYVR